MDDGQLYTGVDNAPEGIFGNEGKENSVKEIKREQERLLKELTPNLKEILKMIDAEIESVMSIDRFITAAKDKEEEVRAELQASALYKQYLVLLKNKFTLVLNQTKRK